MIERGRRSALALNDRILARTEEAGAGHVAHVMKKLARSADLVLGVVRKEGERFFLTPVDKRERREFSIGELNKAQAGDLVLAEPSGRPPRFTARVDAILGDPFAPRSFSMIAIHKHGLRDVFRDEAIAEAIQVAEAAARRRREDLTHLPIVAIDPEDARDHDDAIWASKRDDGGWDAIVAIADVSFYVRPGSELDREARARGNSVYFPDRVVPMLPARTVVGHLLAEGRAGARRARLPPPCRQGRIAQKLAISRAPRFALPQTLPMKMRRRRSTATAGAGRAATG